MTDDEADALLVALVDKLGMEETLAACARWLRRDAAAVRASGMAMSELVAYCVESAADSCDAASCDYYVSTK